MAQADEDRLRLIQSAHEAPHSEGHVTVDLAVGPTKTANRPDEEPGFDPFGWLARLLGEEPEPQLVEPIVASIEAPRAPAYSAAPVVNTTPEGAPEIPRLSKAPKRLSKAPTHSVPPPSKPDRVEANAERLFDRYQPPKFYINDNPHRGGIPLELTEVVIHPNSPNGTVAFMRVERREADHLVRRAAQAGMRAEKYAPSEGIAVMRDYLARRPGTVRVRMSDRIMDGMATNEVDATTLGRTLAAEPGAENYENAFRPDFLMVGPLRKPPPEPPRRPIDRFERKPPTLEKVSMAGSNSSLQPS